LRFSDKGKPVERRGRKATGLKDVDSYDGGAAILAHNGANDSASIPVARIRVSPQGPRR